MRAALARIARLGSGRDGRWIATRVGIPAAVVAAAAAVAVALAAGGGPGAAADGSGAGPAGTATIERRDLAERETFSGTLGYSDSRAVLNSLEGTLTWIAAEGATRTRGQALYRVDERPVLLLSGGVPAYRDMAEGDEGRDVLQLERDLAELGYDPGGDMGVDDGALAPRAAGAGR